MTSQPADRYQFDSAGREARALDDHDRPAVVHGDPGLTGRPRQRAGRGSTGRRRRCARPPAVEERVGPPRRAVDQLVAQDEVARRDLRPQRARRARADDAAHAELAHRPHVGPVVHPVGRQLVVDAVAGQEGHAPVADRAEGHGRRRRAVRRVHRDEGDVVEEAVEPGPAEHPDRPGGRSRRGGLRFALAARRLLDGFESLA